MKGMVFPITFPTHVVLFGKMDAKNTLDGPASILIPFFSQQGINIASDRTAVAKAVAADLLFSKLALQSQKYHQQCVNKFEPVYADHKKIVQMLKGFYLKNPKALGDYGITVVGKRIVYPVTRAEICTAIAFLINYSNGLPVGTSPITSAFLTENNIDIVANLAAIPVIMGLDTQFSTAQGQSQKARQSRDNTMNPVISDMRGTGGFLVKQFPKTPKTCGDWGYVIDISPKGSKLLTMKFKPGETKIIYTAVAGSIIQITGAAPLTITKGKLGTGTPIILKQGDTWQVAKGYTTMTVSNPSLTLNGALTYMSN